MMSWSKLYAAFAIFIIISSYLAAAASASTTGNDQRFLSIRVVGSVFCDTCFQQQFSKSSYFISGASVAVECRNNKQTPDFRIEAKTNEHGQFEVELPSSIFHSHKQVKRCAAKLLHNSEGGGPCKVASIANSPSFSFKSKQGGIYTYSAGFFSYTPQSPLASCSQFVAQTDNTPTSELHKVSIPSDSSKASGLPPFLSPLFPNPFQPPPLFPNPLQPPAVIPNPLQPPAVIPNPLQPPPVIPPVIPNPLLPPPLFPPVIPNPLLPPPLLPPVIPNPLLPPPVIPNPLLPPPLIPIPPLPPNPFTPPA